MVDDNYGQGMSLQQHIAELMLSSLLLLLLLLTCLSPCPFSLYTGHQLFTLAFWHFLQPLLHDLFLIVLQLLNICHVLHKNGYISKH